MKRLDKFLSSSNLGSRNDVKKMIKKGLVKVNDQVVKKADLKISDQDEIKVSDLVIENISYQYIMLNKPSGYISATYDENDQTVLDLIDTKIKGVFPVGRLDKDTEGLLLITNDGKLAHNLLAPKKHVAKTYYAIIKGFVTIEDVEAFKNGIDINEKALTLPATLEIIQASEESKVKVTIKEGKFHQIKRMFIALNKEVIYLKRLTMGPLVLDENLKLKEYRKLTDEELDELKKLM